MTIGNRRSQTQLNRSKQSRAGVLLVAAEMAKSMGKRSLASKLKAMAMNRLNGGKHV